MSAGRGQGQPETNRQPQSSDFASLPPRSGSPHRALEDAILDEGRIARLALARRAAHEALTDPGTITAKRLSRLGPDGRVRFIQELRRGAQTAVKQRSTESGSHSAGSDPARVQPRRSVKTAQEIASKPSVARIEGWWRSCREDAPGFEARARRWGYACGAMLAAACLVLLRLTKF